MSNLLVQEEVSLSQSTPVFIEQQLSSLPAQETQNARFEQLSSWRQASAAASQAGVALKWQTDSHAINSVMAPRSGTIVGIQFQLSAALSAGSGSVSATVGGTAVGTAATIADTVTTAAQVDFATPVAFAKGALLGVKITTNGAFATTPDVSAQLLVRWDPQ